jgi:spore coat protein U-like protein
MLTLVGFDRLAQPWSIGARTQWTTVNYTQLGLAPAQLAPAQLSSANLSYALHTGGSIGIAYVGQRNCDKADARIATLNYSVSLGKMGSLIISALQNLADDSGRTYFAMFSLSLDASTSLYVSSQFMHNSNDYTATLQRNLPLCEGNGYRLQGSSSGAREASYLLQNNVGTYVIDVAKNQSFDHNIAGDLEQPFMYFRCEFHRECQSLAGSRHFHLQRSKAMTNEMNFVINFFILTKNQFLYGIGILLIALPIASFAETRCAISSITSVDFGTYDVFSVLSNNNGIGSITIDCHGGGSNLLVTLSSGQSNTYVSRTMRRGKNLLSYNLYTGAARIVVWGDGTGGSSTIMVNKHGTTTLSIFGQIPAGQDVTVGAYADNITTIINF